MIFFCLTALGACSSSTGGGTVFLPGSGSGSTSPPANTGTPTGDWLKTSAVVAHAQTAFQAAPGTLQNIASDWCNPQVYTKTDAIGNTQYWVRETASSSDARTRHYYFDYDNNPVSQFENRLDYGPILSGGVYQVTCLRYATKYWWEPNANLESHVMTFIVPGPMNQATGQAPPQSFQFDRSFMDKHLEILPPWDPTPGKIMPVYRYTRGAALADIYAHGANYSVHASDESDPAKRFTTTAMNAGSLAKNIDAMGEQGFAQLSDAQIDDLAAIQDNVGILMTDLELLATAQDNPARNYWTIDILNPQVRHNYYRLLKRMKELNPSRLIGDYYRSVVWNNAFVIEGHANPSDVRWRNMLQNPGNNAVMPAYRPFVDTDGQTKSLLDVVDVTTIDCYPKLAIDEVGNVQTMHQIYANMYDTMLLKKVRPGIKAIWFGWPQSDSNPTGRFSLLTPNGTATYDARQQMPAWFAKTTAMLGIIVADGSHLFHDQSPQVNDLNALTEGDGNPSWAPLLPGTPSPMRNDVNGQGSYPRLHNYPLMYAKLGEYQIKQIEPLLSHWEYASYRLDGSNVVPADGDASILNWDAGRRPIVLLLGEPGRRGYLAVHPWGDYRKVYTVTVLIDGVPHDIKLNGKWPESGAF